jgi:hypothetical protein
MSKVARMGARLLSALLDSSPKADRELTTPLRAVTLGWSMDHAWSRTLSCVGLPQIRGRRARRTIAISKEPSLRAPAG